MHTTTDQNTRKNRLIGALATFAYVALWVLLILFVTFRVRVPDETGDGILINFGNTESGWGDQDLAASDELANAANSSQSASPDSPVEHITQTTEPAPEVPPAQPTNTPRPTQTQPTTNTRPAPEPPVEQPRQPDQRALFPGRTQGSTSTSEGTAGGAGNQGNPAGDPTGSHDGTGTGTSGNSFSLDGRSLVGALPKPSYTVREEGRVVIEIHVDQQGRVTRTAFRSVGSTTTNATLVAAAEQAARQAKFNVDENAPFPQIGTITYNFRMQ